MDSAAKNNAVNSYNMPEASKIPNGNLKHLKSGSQANSPPVQNNINKTEDEFLK